MIPYRRRELLLCASILATGLGISAKAEAQTATSTHHRASSHGASVLKKSATKTASKTEAGPSVTAATTAPSTVAARAPAPAFTAQNRHNRALDSIETGRAETVVVTGSALSTSNNQNANPVQIISSKQIEQTGATTLGDYLQRLPSIGSQGTTNSQTNGTDGVSCTDIRNLGYQRVLVLVDGKRAAINGESSCFDMNTINIHQVASVEILKDGGSELYGADAVSGVINIKLKHNLSDGNITVRGGITDVGDGQTGMISGYKGWNFDHGKGNVTVSGSYMTQSGIKQKNRSWATPVQQNDSSDASALTYGSGYPTAGRFIGATSGNDMIANSNGTLSPFTSADRYNYGNDQSLTNSLQDATLSFDAHYDINSHFTPYLNFNYSHRNSSTTMAPEPVSGSIYPSTLPTTLYIPANDPYNTSGEDQYMYKRMGEWGDRRTETASDTYTGIAGVKGEITHGWNYDLSYTYGWNQVSNQVEGVGNYTKLLETYGLRQVTPGDSSSALVYDPSVCNASAGCVLSNPYEKLSSAAAAYSNYTTHENYYYQMRDLNLRINNNHVVHMPWANGGDLGIALGMEHRGEQLAYHPDPLVEAGETLTNSASYTGGGFNVTEGYLEGKATLLHNAFLAKDLTIDGQGRYSSYNTFGGTKNWKVSINWAPIQDIRFRATLGTSYRQPNVYELYGGQSLGYASATDPCDSVQAATYGAKAATVAANCAKQGINTSTFSSTYSGQTPTIYGGSSTLKPETGRTYTFGTVITPRWIPGLSASVEYWHYTLKNMISYLPTQYIMDECYTGADTSYCSDITRNSSTGQLNSVSALYQNIGGLKTSGIDFDLDYRIRITSHDVLTLSNNFQQLVSYLQQYEPGGSWYNYAGRMLYQSGYGMPRVRDYATVGWQHGAIGFTYMMNYIGGMRWNDGTEDLTRANGYGRTSTPGIFSHDVTVTYRWNRWNFQGGVNNLLDKKPPFVASATDNSASALYGSLYMGRYVFLQAGVNF
ncbi:MAG: TonB-dependent receptor [Gluconobacter potus]|uniref:TonB-dependent receptor n=1 Tax=Gluconobacter potus TaxID=2724927 RepID=A0ABR9YNJ2_9PROT|nr:MULTISPECIES: TonB-dependent receptor [Gluconobacter]MBF0865344.1 TonB-dependent receptor [Gluconobacter sp. R71656]MBF0868392.1 TonB-dependent receptor [Gluconobacter sp. R75628]MBF0874374.1 TonB-dependent receptor [Gluconobacter sp. R75629]MBF0883365.1 TonB-dependent receptor [Gluconobacter potus]